MTWKQNKKKNENIVEMKEKEEGKRNDVERKAERKEINGNGEQRKGKGKDK